MEKLNTPFSRIVLLCLIAIFWISSANAQRKSSTSEIALSLGGANILSDLGGSRDVGHGFIIDLEFATTRPVLGLFFRQNFNRHLSARVNLYYAQLTGDDALIPETTMGGNARKYRNLSFKTNVIEASTNLEFNFLPYQPGSLRYRFTPYVMAGVGVFHFDPKAKMNGQWYKLQPLGTEGQGLAQYPGKDYYSTMAVCVPFGAGIKLNVNKQYSLGFEIAHRMTTTDYMDDVSTTYANPAYFYQAYGPEKGALIAALADRSSGENLAQTRPGEQRGDPSDNDTYTFSGLFTLSYLISSSSGVKSLYCPKKF